MYYYTIDTNTMILLLLFCFTDIRELVQTTETEKYDEP